jgi:putative transposase
MKKSRFSEEQIIRILKQQEAGIKVGEVIREHGISEQTFYNWKTKYGGMTSTELRRIKSLETENQQLKKLVAEQALSIQALKEVLGKKL